MQVWDESGQHLRFIYYNTNAQAQKKNYNKRKADSFSISEAGS
jgi:hypothetical protein